MGDPSEAHLPDLFGMSDDVAALDQISKGIFSICDNDHFGTVQTRILVEYIKPYLQPDEGAFADLQITLDPSNTNPYHNIETFCTCMRHWAETVRKRNVDDGNNVTIKNNSQEATEEYFKHKLTPKISKSRISASEPDLVFSTETNNKPILEEQIRELDYQKHKMAEELNSAKAELANSIEANEGLQTELNKVYKKLQNCEMKLIEVEKRNEKLKNDENDAELEAAEKRISKLEQTIATLETNISYLEGEVGQLRDENRKLDQNNDTILKEHEQTLNEIDNLQTELGTLKSELDESKNLIAEQSRENCELKNKIEEYECVIDKLNFDKKTIQETINKTKVFSSSPSLRSQKCNRSTLPTKFDTSKESDSSGDELPLKLHYIAATVGSKENLHDELSKATSESFEDENLPSCDETTQNYDLNISRLTIENIDLKTQISLHHEKELMLLERNTSLQEKLEQNETRIGELTSKLVAHHKLEVESNNLRKTIDALEKDNQAKYLRIVDLTIALDNQSDREVGERNVEGNEYIEEKISKLKREREELGIENRRLQDELDRMTQEENTLKIRIETLLGKIMNLEEANGDLERKRSTMEFEKSTLQHALKETRDELNRLLSQEEEILTENGKLKNENAILRNDISRLESECLSEKSSNSQLEKEQREIIEFGIKLKLETVEKKRDELFEERQALLDQIDMMNEEKFDMLQEISQLKRKLSHKNEEMEIQLRGMKRELRESDADKRGLADEIEKLKEELFELDNLKLKYNELREDYENFTTENQKLQTKINDLTEEIEKYKSNKDEILQLKSNLSGLVQQNEEISCKLEKAKSESAVFKNDKFSLEQENEQLNLKVKHLEERIYELNKSVESIKKNNDVLRVRHDICEQDNRELSRKHSVDEETKRKDFDKIIAEGDKIRNENIELNSIINTLDGEVLQLKDKLSKYHNEKRECDQRTYTLIRENKELLTKLHKQDINVRTQEVAQQKLNEDNHKLKEQVKQTQIAIDTYIEMNNKLKDKIDEVEGLLDERHANLNGMAVELAHLREANENLKKYTKEVSELRDELNKRETIISEIRAENSDLKQAIQISKDEAFLLDECCISYKNKLEETENEVKSLDELCKEKDLMYSKKETEVKRLNEVIKEKLQELKEIKEKYEILNHQIIGLEESKKIVIEGKNKIINELDKEKQKYAKSRQVIDILENELLRLRKAEEKRQIELPTFENLNPEDLTKNPAGILERLDELSAENRILREECKKFAESDKLKIEETNRSFSDTVRKMRKLTETDEDLGEYCRREIEKYKAENAKFKREIANLLEEKQAIMDELKRAESENESAKSELEELLSERESRRSRVSLKQKKSGSSICEKCSKIGVQASNFNKISIQKERLEEKAKDLEDLLHGRKTALVEAELKRTAVEKQLESLDADNRNLKKQLENLETDNHSLKKRLKHFEDRQNSLKMNKKTVEDLTKELENQKGKLKEMTEKVDKNDNEKINNLAYLQRLTDWLSEKWFRLEKNTTAIAAAFKVPETILPRLLSENVTSSQTEESLIYIDKGFRKSGEQMDITSNVLEHLIANKSKVSFKLAQCQTDLTMTSQIEILRRQRSPRFTLKPPTLVHKPPLDSIKERSEELSRLEELKFCSSGDAGRSRDLGVIYPKQDVDFENDRFGEDLPYVEIQQQPLNDADFLEEYFSVSEMTDTELETKFDRIVTICTTQSSQSDAENSQQIACVENKENRLAKELSSCRKILTQFIGEGGELGVAIERLESVLRSCDGISMSTILCQSLKEEGGLTNCMAFMIHYANSLKKRLEIVENDLNTIRQGTPTNQSQLPSSSKNSLELPTFPKHSDVSRRFKFLMPPQLQHTRKKCFRPSIGRKRSRSTYAITWTGVIVTICLILFCVLLSRQIEIPLETNSFDGVWSLFVNRAHRNGRPPT